MSYRIIIEDEKGLHQAILKDTKEAANVIHNNILKMSDITDCIFIIDQKNANGCEIAVRGNAEKIALMYDSLTRFIMVKHPDILLRLISAWDNGKGAVDDKRTIF